MSPRGSSSKRQRVPARLGQELVGDPLVQPPRNHRRQERPRIGVRASPSTTSSGSPASFVARLARGEQHHHRLRQQPARHERQRLRGGAVQPLRVVDHAHKRTLLRRLGQQAKHRQADEEPIRRRALAQPERGLQRVALRSGKALKAIEQRRAQLMQRRERQLHLRLHPDARRTRRSDADPIA